MLKRGIRLKYRADVPSSYVFEYKDPVALGRFIAEGGKIVPSRISKLSNYQQRQVNRAIKRARNIGLLPTGNNNHDRFGRPEAVSPKPFEF